MKSVIVCIASVLALVSCNSLDPDKEFRPLEQDKIVPAGAKVESLWEGSTFTEGPTVNSNGEVLFTDIPENLIMKYSPESKKTLVFRENSGSANGLLWTHDNKLLACEGADGGNRRVTETFNGQIKVISDDYMGKKLNSPNDVALRANGDIYFTDPRYAEKPGEERELDFQSVLFVRGGETILATSALSKPNGILITPDGKTAFISDRHPDETKELVKFDIKDDGRFTNKVVLFRFTQDQRGIDGMAMDTKGNIYATAGQKERAGIYVFSQKGKHLAFIPVPDWPTNCCFGGPDSPHTLYITCQVKKQPDINKKFGLFQIKLLTKGN